MELPHDLVEEIISRLSVKSLVKFKSVSGRWKWTIESHHFKKRHMTRQQSLDPDLLLVDGLPWPDKVSLHAVSNDLPCPYTLPRIIDIPSIEIEVTNRRVTNSCDGMVCFYDSYGIIGIIFVVNPSTRWYRKVHGAGFQELRCSMRERGQPLTYYDGLGFGRDICTGAYKLVWLYKYFTSHQEEGVTTCEVFEFDTNTWRYVKSPHVNFDTWQRPVYKDGLVHWLINEKSPKPRVLSFDFHKETFQAILELPTFSKESTMIRICNLNNRICISEKNWPKQNICVLNSEDNTWEKMYSLDLPFFPIDYLSDYQRYQEACPLAILKKKNKLLLYDLDRTPSLVIYDHDLRSYGKCLEQRLRRSVVPYFPSLISIP